MRWHMSRACRWDYLSDRQPSSYNIKGTIGKHHASHILAALAVCKALDEDLNVAAKALEKAEPTPGRMRLIDGLKKLSLLMTHTIHLQ